MDIQEDFARQAIELARQARLAGNHPFGALLVVDGTVTLTAQNTVIWAASAQQALDEVITYIATDSRADALRGRVVPESNDPAVRELFVFRYPLMYHIEPDRIEVRAFVHGARDFAALRRNQGGE